MSFCVSTDRLALFFLMLTQCLTVWQCYPSFNTPSLIDTEVIHWWRARRAVSVAYNDNAAIHIPEDIIIILTIRILTNSTVNKERSSRVGQCSKHFP